jgi:hypothetical protein
MIGRIQKVESVRTNDQWHGCDEMNVVISARTLNANTELGQGDNVVGLSGKVVLQETPTVSYTPLKGADFVQRVLTPISLDTLFLLDTSGWSSDRLFRLMVDEMNGVENVSAQPIDATHALNRSAGVSYPSVFRGRSFS